MTINPDYLSDEELITQLSDKDFKMRFPENGAGWQVDATAEDGTDLSQTTSGKLSAKITERWEKINQPEKKQTYEEFKKEIEEMKKLAEARYLAEIDILRKPETSEERGRVNQAMSLLVEGRLREDERVYWKGIIQHGGQEYPPYIPQRQTQTRRQVG